MKANSNPEEWIENFLDGTLTDQEVEEFKEKLNFDSEFARLYQERLRLKEAWINAHQLDQTRKEVKRAIQHEKSQRRRQYIQLAAVASVLILIGIPAFLYFNGDFNKKSSITSETTSTDSLQDIIGIPQFKTAEEKASFGVVDSVKLISPVKNQVFNQNDSAIFCWKPGLPDSTFIVITAVKNKQVIFREKIVKGRQFFYLENNFLPTGEYQWFLEGYSIKEEFKIIR